MTLWLSTGLIFTFAAIALILYRWWDMQCIGVTPVRTLTFIAILFTSGLDVGGLIMFPLTEFGGYGNVSENPEYAFANPLAIEFGFWAFLIWGGFYFLTCFYFAIIEPRVKFFEIPMVKLVNNVVIIGTCAFTAYLLLVNLPGTCRCWATANRWCRRSTSSCSCPLRWRCIPAPRSNTSEF